VEAGYLASESDDQIERDFLSPAEYGMTGPDGWFMDDEIRVTIPADALARPEDPRVGPFGVINRTEARDSFGVVTSDEGKLETEESGPPADTESFEASFVEDSFGVPEADHVRRSGLGVGGMSEVPPTPAASRVRDAEDRPPRPSAELRAAATVSERDSGPLHPIKERPAVVVRFPAREVSTTALEPDIAAAENPQIFELERVLKREVLREEGLEVESRPERTYLRVLPGSRRADEVRIEHHGVAVLQAATQAHGQISTRGLGLWFPAHTVHARNSAAVVVGDNCELTQTEHVHIRQAVVSQDDALRSSRVKEIVARAKPGQDNTRVVRDLRAALDKLVQRPAETGPTRAYRPVRADCETNIYKAESVQLGNDATTRLDSRYVVERTTIPAGALLAESEELARRYVEIVADPADNPRALAGFLCDLVGTAENATDDNVLGYADGLPKQQATLLGLFGMTAVNRATSIMIGIGNQLHTELDLTAARMRPDQAIAKGLEQHRAARPQEETPPVELGPRRNPVPSVGPQPRAKPDPPLPPAVRAKPVPEASPIPAPELPWQEPVKDDPTDLSPGGMDL
jgi:hypothetical protein